MNLNPVGKLEKKKWLHSGESGNLMETSYFKYAFQFLRESQPVSENVSTRMGGGNNWQVFKDVLGCNHGS